MTIGDSAPEHSALVDELRFLRGKGVRQLRHLDLPALGKAARICGFGTVEGHDPPAIETMLRAAVAAMESEEGDPLGQAAPYLFGLVQGTIGRTPTDLRRRAAAIYGLEPETFRKKPELLLVERLAEEILILCRRADRPGQPESTALPGAAPAAVTAPGATELASALAHIAHSLQVLGPHEDDPSYQRRFPPIRLPLSALASGGSAPDAATVDVVVRVGGVDSLRDVDIVVSSENVYLEPSRIWAVTLSGALRSAAAVRDRGGHVVTDVVAEELIAWRRANNVGSGPVEPGVVAMTSGGMLADKGIRRLFHAAVAVPRSGTNSYEVSRHAIAVAVDGIFRLADQERKNDPASPPLRSVLLPLFGAGRGGLSGSESFRCLWHALGLALVREPTWEVHLNAFTAAEGVVLLRGLYRALDDDLPGAYG
ncbi:MAG TPA: hypothetical protein VLL08_31555 [Kineosporiaceae bacterium]|nr:hypothetical protein [Kineosporiaceae bacterium]